MRFKFQDSYIQFLKKAKPLIFYSLIFAILLIAFIAYFGNQEGFLLINAKLTPVIGKPAIVFSLWGEWFVMVFLLLVSIKKSWLQLIAVGLTWFLGACFSWIFKLWLYNGLKRPLAFFDPSQVKLNFVAGIDVHAYNSFPSGHTLTAFSSILLFRYIFTDLKTWQEVLLVLIASGCGLSRIILVQHWPVDVLGGLFLGILSTLLAIFIVSNLEIYPGLKKRPV